MPEDAIDDKPVSEASPETKKDDTTVDSSSTETKSEEPKTFADAVGDAIDDVESDYDDGEDSPDQETKTETEDETKEAAQEEETKEETTEETENTEEESEEETEAEENEEETEVPEKYSDDPAWKRIMKERNESREEVVELKKANEASAPRLELYEAIGDKSMDWYAKFITTAQTNPGAALKLINPTLQILLERSGHTLSASLKKDVEDGRLTQEQALNQSKLEAKNRSLEGNGDAEKEHLKVEAQKANAHALQDASETWENQKRSKDPDFETIEASVMDAISAEVTRLGGLPPLAELPKFLDEQYAKVKERYKGNLPKRKKKEVKKAATVNTPKGSEQIDYKEKDGISVTEQILIANDI